MRERDVSLAVALHIHFTHLVHSVHCARPILSADTLRSTADTADALAFVGLSAIAAAPPYRPDDPNSTGINDCGRIGKIVEAYCLLSKAKLMSAALHANHPNLPLVFVLTHFGFPPILAPGSGTDFMEAKAMKWHPFGK